MTGQQTTPPDLAAHVEHWERVLIDHVADDFGRCAGCLTSVDGRPSWPCGPLVGARWSLEAYRRGQAER